MSWLYRLSLLFDGLQTSSADPGTLLDYSQLGLEMSGDLRVDVDRLRSAVDTLRAAPSNVPLALPAEVLDDLADLVGDWQHLDEFVGDVGRGFARTVHPGWDGNRALVLPGVVTLPNWALRSFGAIGFANRDEAVAAAQRDAAAFAEGPAGVAAMERLAGGVARGGHDPAYAVAFVEAMTPAELAGVVDLIEGAYLTGDPQRPEPGWGSEQLVSFGLVLSTAMDTLPGIGRGSRLDPTNAELAEGDRLDSAWVEGFVASFGRQGDEELWDQSMLVAHAALPTGVLLDTVGPQLAARLGRDHAVPYERLRNERVEVWGSHQPALIETNLLEGLGNNGEASLRWLGAGDTGFTSNAQALLHYEPGMPIAGLPISDDALEGFGRAGSSVFDAAFSQQPPSVSLDLFSEVVDTVAADEGLAHPDMAPGLARGAATHIDTISAWINDDFDASQDEPTGPFLATGTYLRELFRDDDAARILRSTASDYLTDRLADVPTDALGRASHLVDTGRVLGVMAQSDANAVIGIAEDNAAHADVVGDQLDYVLGRMPIVGPELARTAGAAAGQVNDLLDALGTSSGEYFADPTDTTEQAEDQARRRLVQAKLAIATEVAHAHCEQGTWNWLEIKAATIHAVSDAGIPLHTVDLDFFDGNPNDPLRPIKAIEHMSNEERVAYITWFNTTAIVTEDSGTPPDLQPRVDYNELLRGFDDAEGALVYRT